MYHPATALWGTSSPRVIWLYCSKLSNFPVPNAPNKPSPLAKSELLLAEMVTYALEIRGHIEPPRNQGIVHSQQVCLRFVGTVT